jgi:hypothetical protein
MSPHFWSLLGGYTRKAAFYEGIVKALTFPSPLRNDCTKLKTKFKRLTFNFLGWLIALDRTETGSRIVLPERLFNLIFK